MKTKLLSATLVSLACFAPAHAAWAELTFQLLYKFNGTTKGGEPFAGLVQGSDGNFYGTTAKGGTSPACYAGCGTVFKITPGGVLTTLHSFNGLDGFEPQGTLVQGNDGNFYGTTGSGGTGRYGTVFKITPGGMLTTLASFDASNGSIPVGLVQGSDGNFYGTTAGNGGGDPTTGTVFQITPDGSLTTLFSFSGPDGSGPFGSLVQGGDASFYGTTSEGGTNGGWGTAFRITTNGMLTSLFSFNGTNGAVPHVALMQGSDGNFYGTTSNGGTGYGGTPGTGFGTIFRLALPPVITAITSSNDTVTLTWSSFTNGIYRVEYKPSLAATSWTALTPDVTATESTASFTDNPLGDTERYYRIVLLP